MDFKVCEKGHTRTIGPWVSFFSVIRGGCVRCKMEDKEAKRLIPIEKVEPLNPKSLHDARTPARADL